MHVCMYLFKAVSHPQQLSYFVGCMNSPDHIRLGICGVRQNSSVVDEELHLASKTSPSIGLEGQFVSIWDPCSTNVGVSNDHSWRSC